MTTQDLCDYHFSSLKQKVIVTKTPEGSSPLYDMFKDKQSRDKDYDYKEVAKFDLPKYKEGDYKEFDSRPYRMYKVLHSTDSANLCKIRDRKFWVSKELCRTNAGYNFVSCNINISYVKDTIETDNIDGDDIIF